MNANDCLGFKDVGPFLDALANWKDFRGAVTYMVVCSRQISRLHGASDILYIGESDNFGGNDSSRLWTYNYSRSPKYRNDYRIVEYPTRLVNAGDAVSLRICTGSVQPADSQTIPRFTSASVQRRTLGVTTPELPVQRAQM
jgi:hypothetical protein